MDEENPSRSFKLGIKLLARVLSGRTLRKGSGHGCWRKASVERKTYVESIDERKTSSQLKKSFKEVLGACFCEATSAFGCRVCFPHCR